jgi:hypothetical protein
MEAFSMQVWALAGAVCYHGSGGLGHVLFAIRDGSALDGAGL